MAALAGTYAARKEAAGVLRYAMEQDINAAIPESLIFEAARSAIAMAAEVYTREVGAAMAEFEGGMRALLGLSGKSGLAGSS
jgi:hypothetical protein